MKFMNFGNKWCALIRACLISARSSGLVNESPTDEFQLFRGLHQGDNLSPFLFILVMEGLHVATEDANDVNLFYGVQVGSGSLRLSHLFYHDDSIFLGEWVKGNIFNIAIILQCFYLVSYLKINMQKSNIYGVCVPFKEVEQMALLVGCKSDRFPFTYL